MPESAAGIRAAIAELEARRSLLGDSLVDAALAPLKARLAELGSGPGAPAAGPPATGAEETGTAERKIVTALFADFAGFTRLVAKGDPETVRELVGAAFAALVPVIEKYGGTIEKFMGDGVMVLFGAPHAHEDDPRRACLAALDMFEALGRFNARRGSALAMHMGIGTGLVVAGSLGVRGHSAYSAVGSAVNRAARISSLASAGEIMVDARTAELAGEGLGFRESAPAMLKGFEDSVRVFALEGHSPEAGGLGETLAFAGRREELAALDAAWKARKGNALLAVTGEAGIGKTRLAHEWCNRLLRAAPEGAEPVILETKGSPFESSSGWRVLAGLVESVANLPAHAAPAERSELLASRLEALGLAGPLRLSLGGLLESAAAAAEDEAERLPAFENPVPALGALLDAVAGSRPLVFIADDWQWWDHASAQSLAELASLPRRGPACWLLLSREPVDLAPPAASPDLALPLAPLGPPEVRELAEANLPPGLDLPCFAEELARAGGVPLFLEEVVARAREGQACPPCDPELALVEACGMSPALFSLITARIDALPPEAREAARVGAVLGDRFPRGLLARLSGENGLRELERRGILVDGPEEDSLAFRNDLLREAAYATLVERSRRELHGKAARALKEGWPEYSGRRPDILARHWHRAGEPRKALPYYREAGEALFWRKAFAGAAELLGTGLALARETGSTLRVAELLVFLGRCRAAMGAVDEALAMYDEARSIYRGLSNASRESSVLRARSYTLIRAGRSAEAEASLREALALARDMGSTRDKAMALAELADLLRARGGAGEALAFSEEALSLAESARMLPLYRRMLFTRGACLEESGQTEEARRCFLKCADVCSLSGEADLGSRAAARATSCAGIDPDAPSREN